MLFGNEVLKRKSTPQKMNKLQKKEKNILQNNTKITKNRIRSEEDMTNDQF